MKRRRRETLYLPSHPCSSRCGGFSTEGSLVRSARDLSSTPLSHLNTSPDSERASCVRDTEETFV